MANVKFEIDVLLKGLQNITKLASTVKQAAGDMSKSFKQQVSALKETNVELDKNAKFLSKSAERAGFLAFQFLFLRNIALRTLQDIQFFFQDLVTEGAKGQDAMVRAIAQSGISLRMDLAESREAFEFLNDAILTLGGGRTIFSVEEVSAVVKDVGKSTSFTGTEMEKAAKNIGVTQQVLRLMTIEELDVQDATKGLIKTMNNFNLGLKDVKMATDTLIRVNQNSAVTIDELIRSFGFAASSAAKFGLDFQETAGIIGIVADRMGEGAGAAGRNFNQLLIQLRQNAFKVDGVLSHFGETIFDENRNLKNFTEIINTMRRGFQKAGPAQGELRLAMEDAMKLETRATRVLDILTTQTEEATNAAIEFARSGDVTGLDELFGSTAEAKMKKFENALNALKIQFVGGLTPAITVLSESMVQLLSTKEVEMLFIEFGKVLAEEVIPLMRFGAQMIALFSKVMMKNRWAVKLMAKGLVALVAVLGTLVVIGTVGLMITAFGSAVLKMATFFGISQIALTALLKGFLKFFVVLLAIALIVVGVRTLFSTLIDGFQEGEEAMIALSLAAIGVGIALSWAFGGRKGLIAGIATAGAIAAMMAVLHLSEGSKDQIDEMNKELEKTKVVAEGLPTGFDPLGLGGIQGPEFDTGKFGEIANKIDEALRDARKKLATFIEVDIPKFFNTDLPAAFATVAPTLGVIGMMIAMMWEGPLKEFFTKTIPNFFFQDLPNAIGSVMPTLEGIGNIIGKAIEDGVKAFLDFVQWIQDALAEVTPQDLIDKGMEWGQALIDGIINAITVDLPTRIMETLGSLGDAFNLGQQAFGEEMTSLNQGMQSVDPELKAQLDEQMIMLIAAVDLDRQQLEQLTGLLVILNDSEHYTGLLNLLPLKLATEKLQVDLLTTMNNQLGLRAIPLIEEMITNFRKTIDALDRVQRAFDRLVEEIDRLASKIAKTQVQTTRNSRGQVTGFRLVGGVSIAEVRDLATNVFQAGGIVRKPVTGLVGEAGPEAIIPLKQLEGLLGSGSVTNNITVNVAGVADSTTARDIAERVAEEINARIKGKSTLRRLI